MPDHLRVLVVDDEPPARGELAYMIEQLEPVASVEAVGSGVEALRALESTLFDAVFLDIAMPGMDGAEVGRRARLLHPALPLIFVSGYFDTAALEAVPDVTVLRKPVTLEGLQRAVSSVLA